MAHRSDAAGLDPDRWVAPVIDRPRPRGVDRGVVVAEVLAELQDSQSTWTRTDVVRHLARRIPVGLGDAEAARAWIETTADEMLARPSIVGLAAPEPPPPGDLRRRDGRSVFERHAATRYSTDSTLAVEQRVLDIATTGRGAGRGVAERVAVDATIAHNGLGDDQAAAVRSVTQDGDTVACVVGPAGTGKSHTMGAAAHAWTASAIAVRGLAVSAAAAGVLQAETGIGSDTIAKFLHEHDRPGGPGPAWRLHPGEVLVVDEASMVPSADLARLVILADEAGGKVVLVGDWAQLGAVEGGGLFRLLAHDHTVDRAVLIADDSTTAEALYVGMTRGRQSNTALVVTDPDDLDHTRTEERTAREVLTSALQRVSGERSATEELRHALVASESLAVLKPRLASVDAEIARECPPDRTVDLQRLAERRSQLERHARPGRLTRAGRDDRRQLLQLDERQHELESAQEHRHDWLEVSFDVVGRVRRFG